MTEYRIRNKAGQYISKQGKNYNFTDKNNGTIFNDIQIAQSFANRLKLFYGGDVEFYLEKK